MQASNSAVRYALNLASISTCDRAQLLEDSNQADELVCLTFDCNGHYLATAAADGTIILYETESFKPLFTWMDHRGEVNKVRCRGKVVSYACSDRELVACV